MPDEFLDNDGSSYSMLQRNFNEAWVQYILEYPTPAVEGAEKEKKYIVNMLVPVINQAARSNLAKSDVYLALWAYDNIWTSYFIYKRKGKRDADLLMLMRTLREGYSLMLHRSIEMRQMAMILEPKQSVFQRFTDNTQRKIGFFKGKKSKKEESMDGER